MTEIMAQLAELHSATLAILSIVGEIVLIARRVDYRSRHTQDRALYPVALQEECWRYWDNGQKIAAIKYGQRGRVSYKSVYRYFRKELIALGVYDWEAFRGILRARTQRIYRQTIE